MIEARIIDPVTGRLAKVNDGGVLAVGPVLPSIPFNATLNVDDVPVNIVPAKADHKFCVTGALFTGNKSISTTTDAVVTIFVAENETTSESIGSIFVIPIARSSSRDVTGVLLEVEAGRWINGITTDNDVFMTILGYYVKDET